MGSSEFFFPKKFPLRWMLIITTHDHHTTTTTIMIQPSWPCLRPCLKYLGKNFVIVAHAPQSAIRPCIALHTLSSGTHSFFYQLWTIYYLSSGGLGLYFFFITVFLYPEHYIDHEWKDVSVEGSRVLECTYICNV